MMINLKDTQTERNPATMQNATVNRAILYFCIVKIVRLRESYYMELL